MKMPPLPDNELQRLRALQRTRLLDTGAESRFDRLTQVAQHSFQVDIALVSLVDSERQWFKSAQGLDACETARDISFCGHAILNDRILVVEDALEDERFFDNPLVTEAPHIRFYAGAPLRSADGYHLGTLCVIDSRPRRFDDRDARTLADCVEEQIGRQRLEALRQSLAESEYRAQLIIEGANIGTWQCDLQSGQCRFNERWAEMLGHRLDELGQLTIETWRERVHPDDLELASSQLERHIKGLESVYECRVRMRHKNGRWVWVHSRGRLLSCGDDGRPGIIYGTHIDISAEREAMIQLERRNKALAVLNRMAFKLQGSVDERITQALALGREFLQLDLAIASEVIGDVYMVRWVSAPKGAGVEPGLRFELVQTYCRLMLEQQGVLAIDHMGQSAYASAVCYRNMGLEAYIATRLEVNGELFGTLNFSSATPRAQPFDDTDRMFLALMAHWLSDMLSRQRQQDRFDKLAEQLPGVIYQFRRWPDGHSAFPYSSAGMEQLYRLPPQAVREDAGAVFERIHAQDLDSVAESIVRSERELSDWHVQYRVLQGDGSSHWVEGRARPERLDDGSTIWHGYLTDIEHEKQAELALTASEQRLRGLFELSSIGIALSDARTGRFLDVNRALLGATGYGKAELLNLGLSSLTPAKYAQADEQAGEALARDGRYGAFEKELLRRDGARFPVRQQGMLIRDAGGQPLIWTLIEDITELKKVERMQKEFVSTVSHELRTPLTSITGSLGLLTRGALGPLPEQVFRLVEVAHNNGRRLHLLINDLLDMEKLVAGKMHFDVRPHDLADLLHEAVECHRPLGEDRGVTLVLGETPARVQVLVDRDRLLQALANLLSNAVKFSPDHGRVDIDTEPAGQGCWRVLVRDRGEGVPQEFRSRIFEKFAQADSSDTRRKGGTGLGLAITRELMERMGGGVGFDSTPGQGACFWLNIPEAG
ncbi:PAS domain-containing protein [Oceanimonas sp. MB9]|uniref:PAS domain-containing protein n=1 Tax=Oceanimonas sp. MB9 TaxID=2588453 RepID=UPI0013F5A01C|nr:PAS domain-containing protein [Oceanimonas sp. MB9]NHH99192.1 Signal transduction histidine-protein kinase BarA [Oceanimonas sp. MB9]